ncbi:family 16 glycoside hydrolase [Curtobacterium caseinilyticum]|uniref:DUF1080 domain-containing protein n=1 Tax=Curtobacterium caseinilyticum TaxID=3055137 RepID=A0ABT7TPN4_9MICO|nr:family 16 glycoside hydrolase [Curtobacterium caseinilyticum]MDM7891566.1 DUF1080 domain-containing protein [Curtobacterium caseinilyticum]
MTARPVVVLGAFAAAVLALVTGVGTTTASTQAAYTAALSNRSTASTVSDYSRSNLPFRDSFAGGQGAWKTYGGRWTTQTVSGYGTFTETSGSSDGPKAVTGDPAWTDYTMQADVQVNSGTDAGLLVRVTRPASGVNGFTGYSVSLGLSDNTLSVSRMNDGTTTQLARSTIAGTLRAGQFYHVVVQAAGCGITAWSSTVGANDWTKVSASESSADCRSKGAVGLRGNGSAAGFRYVTVSAGALSASQASDPYNSTLTTGRFEDGAPARVYGGTWAVDQPEERIRSVAYSGQDGDKQVLNRVWGDMTLTGDVRLMRKPTGGTDAGFNVRVVDPSTGPDSLRAFYVGVSATGMVIGQHTNPGFTGTFVPFGRTVQAEEWWHLTVEAVGCTITATASPSAGGTPVQGKVDFGNCSLTSGAVGIREQGLEAQWRNIAVTPR